MLQRRTKDVLTMRTLRRRPKSYAPGAVRAWATTHTMARHRLHKTERAPTFSEEENPLLRMHQCKYCR